MKSSYLRWAAPTKRPAYLFQHTFTDDFAD